LTVGVVLGSGVVGWLVGAGVDGEFVGAGVAGIAVGDTEGWLVGVGDVGECVGAEVGEGVQMVPALALIKLGMVSGAISYCSSY